MSGSALKILNRHREELVDLLADERPAYQPVGGRRYVALLLVAASEAALNEALHCEGQVPEVQAVDGAHASEDGPPGMGAKLCQDCDAYSNTTRMRPTVDGCWLCDGCMEDRGPEAASPTVTVTTLAADGRAHDEQVKRGPPLNSTDRVNLDEVCAGCPHTWGKHESSSPHRCYVPACSCVLFSRKRPQITGPNVLDQAEWDGAGLVVPDSLTPEEREASLSRIREDRLKREWFVWEGEVRVSARGWVHDGRAVWVRVSPAKDGPGLCLEAATVLEPVPLVLDLDTVGFAVRHSLRDAAAKAMEARKSAAAGRTS